MEEYNTCRTGKTLIQLLKFSPLNFKPRLHLQRRFDPQKKCRTVAEVKYATKMRLKNIYPEKYVMKPSK